MDFTIKQAAKITGIPADTLRYYDKEGIISPKRRENEYRYYDESDITILKNIVVMKYARFTLLEMKNMEKLFIREPNIECNEISKSILNAKIAELKQAICNYQKIIGLMEELLQMAGSAESYHKNERQIAEFINQIFDDIRSGNLPSGSSAKSNKKDAK